MTNLKRRQFIIATLFLAVIYTSGCDFEDPYVPESAGSSTLTGRIFTEPAMDVSGSEILLRGNRSFASVTDEDGVFHFEDIPPGDYSLQVQKRPYLQYDQSVNIRKSEDKDLGDIHIELKGAIAGIIPNDKVSIIHGEVEVIVYIDGVPFVPQENTQDGLIIDLSSPTSDISVQASAKITVYIDNIPYSATVQGEGRFIVEFIEPGIYNDIRVKLNSQENAFPLVSDGPVVVKSGQTRSIP